MVYATKGAGGTVLLLFASLDTLQLLLPRFKQLDALLALGEASFFRQRVLFGLEHADHLVDAGFELGERLLQEVWVFDGAEDGALGTVRFDRIRVGLSKVSREGAGWVLCRDTGSAKVGGLVRVFAVVS